MVAALNIEWGRYRSWEGPFWRGLHRYKLPLHPSEEDRILQVITATEGGTFDAYNGYDGQFASLGLIQVIERSQYSVSALLGAVARRDRSLIASVDDWCKERGYVFKPNHRGRYRFFFRNNEVDTAEECERLFYLRSDGHKGTWDDASKTYAKTLAAAIASVMELPEAQKEQVNFLVPRLKLYAFGKSKDVIGSAPNTPIGKAFVAAYLTFAINNPGRANKHLCIVLGRTQNAAWTRDWFIEVLRELTFGPNIAIYPHRYNAIRPSLEQLYGIDLPDFADDLKRWKHTSYNTLEIQQALLSLGYDLGPWGADGKYGRKTREAMFAFEEAHDIPEKERDGMPDPITMSRMRDVLQARGFEILTRTVA